MNCERCAALQSDVTAIKTTLDRMDHELFGNGQPGKIETFSSRIGSLERWRAYLSGALAVIGLLVAYIVKRA